MLPVDPIGQRFRQPTSSATGKSISMSVDGSGTDAGLLLPTESPVTTTARGALAVVSVLKLAELMPPAPNGPLGVNELASAKPLD